MKKYINNIVGGRYYILSGLGEGGFSKVFKAKDLVTGRFCALKKYESSDPKNRRGLQESMEKELGALKNCCHPNLPEIYNIISFENEYFLVMEYAEGDNLRDITEKTGKLPKKTVKIIMEQVLGALYYLHSMDPPIIYRDLKPSNILYSENGKVKLIDFGTAKRYSREIEIRSEAFGTVGFAAPEQFWPEGGSLYNTDKRTDIYGAGATLYFLLTGRVFKQGDRISIRHAGFRKIIKKCLDIDPDKRYQDCIDLMCDLRKA